MWLKKMQHKKLQFILVGLVLFITAGLFNMCLSFTGELSGFSKKGINEENSPDAYLLTIGTSDFNNYFTDGKNREEVESVTTLAGKTISVPIKYNGNDITMYYDMMLSADEYQKWGYLEVVGGDKNEAPPSVGEVWISETMAVPNHIKTGDMITLEYAQPLELKVTGIYRTTCFPKAVGFSPMLVAKEDLSKALNSQDAALFAVNIKNYSDSRIDELFGSSAYCIVARSRDDAQANLTEFSNMFGVIGTLAAFVIFFVAMVILKFIIKNNLIKEFRTIGIYKSLGYSTGQIKGFYMKGFMFTGIIAITLGAFISLSVVYMIGKLSTEYVEGFAISTISVLISTISILILMALLYINLRSALKRVGKITPVEAIAVGTAASDKKLKPSVLKYSKTPFSMAVNDIFKYKKSSVMMSLVLTSSIFLSMLFVMIWFSSIKMTENSNLWFCLPKSDTYITGDISEELKEYLNNSPYVKSAVYGDFSYTKEAKLPDNEKITGSIRYDAYSDFSENITGIHIKGQIPKSKNELVAGVKLLKAAGLQIGDKLKLTINNVTKEYNITGSYNTVADSGQKVMMTTDALRESIPEYNSSRAYIRLNNRTDLAAFKNEMERKFTGVVVDRKWLALENSVESIRVMLETISSILVAIFIMFSILNIVIVVMMDNKNWRRKFGIMKSLGFTTRYIILQNIYKYFILAVFSSAVSLSLHLAVSQEIMAALLIDAFINSKQLLFLLLVGFVGLIIAATWAICLKIREISPVELMEE